MAETPNLGLDLVEQGQQRPDLTVNAAMLVLDEAVDRLEFGPVASRPATAPDNLYWVTTDSPKQLYGPDGAGAWVLLGSLEGEGSGAADHGHTATGDGGTLSRPRVTQGVSFTALSAKPAAPASGQVLLYRRTDGLFYQQTSDGTETALGSGGGGGGGHTIQDEGSGLAARGALNFVGAGVTAADDAGNDATVVTIPGPGTAGHVIQDEGSGLTQRANLDFAGAGVAVTDNAGANKTVVTIPDWAPKDAQYVVLALNGALSAEVTLASLFDQGTLAARPAAGTAGRYYLATNENGGTLYRDNGAGWTQAAPGVTPLVYAPPGASYVVLSGDATLTNEAVLGTAVIRAGAIGDLPAASSVAAGTIYVATDDAGGTSYRSNGTSWAPMGASVNATASGDGHAIQEEGSGLTQRANLNFVGAGVTATDDSGNDATVITIPGSDDSELADNLGDSTDLGFGDALIATKLNRTGSAARTLHAVEEDRWDAYKFGATGDGTTDDLAALQAMVRAYSAPGAHVGRRITLPAGTFRLSGPLRLDRSVILEGESAPGWFGATVLLVDAGQTGIIVDRATTSPQSSNGDWSVIRHLVIKAAAKTTTAHGIRLHARATIDSCHIEDFAGNGLHIEADAGGSPSTNANNWLIMNSRAQNCGGDGLFVSGVDANNGACFHSSFGDNQGWGVRDSSHEGNFYCSINSEANDLGAYTNTNANAHCTFFGCYSEGGQGASLFTKGTVIIGGQHGAGFQAASLGPHMDTTDVREFQVSRGLCAVNTLGAVTTRVTLGKDDATLTGLSLFTSDVNNDWRLRYHAVDGSWDWLYGGLDAHIAMRMTTAQSPKGEGLIQFPKGLELGPDAHRSYISAYTEQPASGGATGDFLINSVPAAGGAAGWIKTGAGWKPWGVVDLLASTNQWAPQQINGHFGMQHVAHPGDPSAGFSTFRAHTDGKPIWTLPNGTQYDLTGTGPDLTALGNIWAEAQQFEKHLGLKHIAGVTPSAGYTVVYPRTSDGHPMARFPSGAEIDLAYVPLTATVAWNPPSLPPGEWVDAEVTVTGAALGDVATCGFSLALPAGVMFYQPQVSAANTVRVTLQNWGTSAVDLASGTLRVMVHKAP